MTKIGYAFSILFLFYISCKNSDQQSTNLHKINFNYKNISDELFLNNMAKVIDMPPITKDSNALFIRIWLWNDTAYVVNISIDEKYNECNIQKLTSSIIDSIEYVKILGEFANLKPNSGWKNFLDTLNIYKIQTLESGSKELLKKDFATPMSYIQFEINDHGKYHYYKYLEPSFYRYIDTPSMRVFNFLKYLDYEFQVQIYTPPEKMFAYPNAQK